MATVAAQPTKTFVKAAASVGRLSRKRRIAVWSLVVLATLIALVEFAHDLFVKRQMLDNTAWKNASTQVIQDPEVQTALSAYRREPAVRQRERRAAARAEAPTESRPARADTIASALGRRQSEPHRRSSLGRASKSVSINLSATAHEKLVNVLENKTGHGISTGNGVVTLNLHTCRDGAGPRSSGYLILPWQKIPADCGHDHRS